MTNKIKNRQDKELALNVLLVTQITVTKNIKTREKENNKKTINKQNPPHITSL